MVAGLGVAVAISPQDARQETFKKDLQPFLTKYCGKCHGNKDTASAEVWLGTKDAAHLLKEPATWEKTVRALETGHMPPSSQAQPTAAERQLAVRSIQGIISGDCGVPNPGRVTLRRLNRAEYNNTVRDLFGFDIHPADDFPADTIGNGFDNIGDVLSMSSLHMEQYLKAAELLAEKAIWMPDSVSKTYSADQIKAGEGYAAERDGVLGFFSNGPGTVPHSFPRDGDYRISVKAAGQQAGDQLVKLRLSVGSQAIGEFEVKGTASKPLVYQFPVNLKAGLKTVKVEFINDYYQPSAPEGQRDRNAMIWSITVEGPTNRPANLPESHRAIMVARPEQVGRDAALRQIFTQFAKRAFRRPVGGDELTRILKICDEVNANQEPFERQVQVGIMACLVSPRFLFRFELDPANATIRELDDYELASRMSYFLWSSMPDEELLRLAESKELHKPEVLKAQVERMLSSVKTRELGENFAAQWLEVRKLENSRPSAEDFPNFTPQLRSAMAQEPVKYFNYVAMQRKSVLDLLDSSFTYINSDLAKLYKLPDPGTKDVQLTELPAGRRGGILRMASILTVTSNPTRTSPVKRGRFVLENILAAPVPMPPPGTPSLEKAGEKISGATVRERLAQHRADPACSVCHDRMDGLGLALENFNPIGAWRTEDGGAKVDASGVLPGNIKVNGVDDLTKVLMTNKDDFVRCVAEKMLTFALGRGLEISDNCHIQEIVTKTKAANYNMGALILAIVESEPFRKKKVS